MADDNRRFRTLSYEMLAMPFDCPMLELADLAASPLGLQCGHHSPHAFD
jgi:hypothetical protein